MCKLTLLFLIVSSAFGQLILTTLGSVSDLTTSTVPASGSGCSAPPSFTSFTHTDQRVHLYFVISGLLPDSEVSVRWIRLRDNRWYATSRWSRVASGGNWCFTGAWLDISTFSAEDFGDWRVDVYINNSSSGASRSFSIQGYTPPPNPTLGYEGYFDGIDCEHIWGWARDTHNPSATLYVDIYIDGSKLASIPANQYRTDLPGTRYYAFNFYNLPAHVKDGQAHEIKVVYAGTDHHLVGSPKAFQRSCGAAPTTYYDWEFNPFVTHVAQSEDWLCGPSTVSMWVDYINRSYNASFGSTDPRYIALQFGLTDRTELSTFMSMMYINTPAGYLFSSIGYKNEHAAVRGIMATIARYREPVAILGGDRYGPLQSLFGWSSGSHYLLVRGGRATRNPSSFQTADDHIAGVWVNDSTQFSLRLYPNGPVSGMYNDQVYTPDRLMRYWGTTGPWYPLDKRHRSIERYHEQGSIVDNNNTYTTY